MQATPIDATRTSKYSYSAEGSCFIRTKLVPIPPPGILEERIRLVMEQEEWWKQQQKLIAPEEDFEKGLGGLWFNGFDTEVELPTASELGLINRDFTVEAMIRIDEFKGGDETILGTAGSRYSKGLHLVLRNQRMYMGFYGNDLRGKTIVPSDVWCHVAYRYDINKKEQSVFLNGVLDNKAQGHPPFSGNYPVYIGRWLGG
ncbi:MAG: LamG domain-containing protein, partial [Deltaproteobacteria bacterium]|nr:LamG domain-containing protein [Deltaproteobacteria bacterium]